jgi:LytR cell envelope-related transcriptional attenuator
VEHAESIEPARTWRNATLVAGAIAAAELVALILLGTALLAKPVARASAAEKKAAPKTATPPAHHQPRVHKQTRPVLAPRRLSVLVLNGNGLSGAAATQASVLRSLGYRVADVGNAQRSDYARTIVMFRRGYQREAARLSRRLPGAVTGPLDGLRHSQLHGAQLALVVGT